MSTEQMKESENLYRSSVQSIKEGYKQMLAITKVLSPSFPPHPDSVASLWSFMVIKHFRNLLFPKFLVFPKLFPNSFGLQDLLNMKA